MMIFFPCSIKHVTTGRDVKGSNCLGFFLLTGFPEQDWPAFDPSLAWSTFILPVILTQA